MAKEKPVGCITSIPEKFLYEYKMQKANFIKFRLIWLSVFMAGLFLLANLASFYFNPEIQEAKRVLVVSLMIAGSAAVIFASHIVKCLHTAKLYGYLFTAYVLAVLVFAPTDQEVFSFTQYVITLFFIGLMIPWFIRDVAVLVAMHFVAFWGYCQMRDFEVINFAKTYFGNDPFIVGSIYITFAALIVATVRIYENKRDVHNFVLLKETETQKHQMEEELKFASRIHETLIPESVSTPFADIAVKYVPMHNVGGDYAKFHFLDEDRLVFFISDVTGHGVPAALLVNRLHAEFNSLVQSIEEPGALLKRLNTFISSEFGGTAMYLSACCGVIDFNKNTIRYSNFGHPSQYVYRMKNHNVTDLTSQAPLLGIDIFDLDGVYESEVSYESGDSLLLFTDGVVETRSAKGEEFGDERLKELVAKYEDRGAAEAITKMMDELNRFSKGVFRDDIFLVMIKTHKDKREVVQQEDLTLEAL